MPYNGDRLGLQGVVVNDADDAVHVNPLHELRRLVKVDEANLQVGGLVNLVHRSLVIAPDIHQDVWSRPCTLLTLCSLFT
jgi:hypothetical protein